MYNVVWKFWKKQTSLITKRVAPLLVYMTSR